MTTITHDLFLDHPLPCLDELAELRCVSADFRPRMLR
jgi:hypothetical protein